MYACHVQWVLLSIAITAAATPVEFRNTRAAFTVPQSVKKPFVKTGPAALAALYRKYNKVAPHAVKTAATNVKGTVPASPEDYDSEYLSTVSIGGQTVNLNFDTGSSDLWVFSSQLKDSLKQDHDVYSPSISRGSRLLAGEYWTILYGDNSEAEGNVYLDTVKVGATTAINQAVEAAQSVSTSFEQDIDSDGILGLAFDLVNQIKPDRQKTFFSNVRSTLAAPLFTVDLKRGKPGSYDFGYVDDSKHTGSITYVPVDSRNGFWGFTSNGYAVGNSGFTSTRIDAIMDTGTSLILLPEAVVTAYYKQVPSAIYSEEQGGWTLPCIAAPPSITLGFGWYKAVVPGSYINYGPVESGGVLCYGGIQKNSGIGFSIFGDVFIKSQFVVFDASGPRLGVAPKMLQS
ncbi:uncharacterized protein KY384_007002 [Bacidia gigantensis]|uniref:uncharacterized protein n=1 Tax=Bacidia gigantensis TaxID=2732470 RepID=UPI001D05AC7B|nr:uncharacterized protein KY384_007002 [Bacidia gigantensis]KAG8528086.1 hypothetical protein KY384_007002 [Bacidia gigantensis]